MKRHFTFMALICLLSAMAEANDYQWQTVKKRSTGGGGTSVTGRVVPQDGALYIESARVQGRVMTIMKREGERVAQGTPLYSISSAECFSLGEEKRVSMSQKLDELIKGVENRETQLGLKLQGNECYVVSAHAGVLTKRNLEAGASFNSGDPLATVLDTNRLTVELDVPERDLAKLKPGQKVQFQFASHPGENYSSVIQTVVPTIDPQTRSAKARLKPVKLPANISLETLIFGSINEGSGELLLEVPSTALIFFRNKRFVVSGGEQNPHPIDVNVINESDSTSAIRPVKTEELHEGDLIATHDAVFLLKKLSDQSTP
ncbi:MAG: efflux RND transporter periplasmic adaptor subunit [Pseudobdellovibrionaceae bacterium]